MAVEQACERVFVNHREREVVGLHTGVSLPIRRVTEESSTLDETLECSRWIPPTQLFAHSLRRINRVRWTARKENAGPQAEHKRSAQGHRGDLKLLTVLAWRRTLHLFFGTGCCRRLLLPSCLCASLCPAPVAFEGPMSLPEGYLWRLAFDV